MDHMQNWNSSTNKKKETSTTAERHFQPNLQSRQEKKL